MKNIKSHLSEFKEQLQASKNIVILTHHRPDGDAIGSSLALALFLKKKGFFPQVIIPSAFSEQFNFLKGVEDVLNFETEREKTIRLIEEAELIFCLDFNSIARLNQLATILSRAKAPKIMVDHHPEPDNFAKFEYCNDKYGSTAELIYELILMIDSDYQFETSVAEAIYTGILTDTGMFQYPSTRAETFKIAANLFDAGVNGNKIFNHIYNNYSENRLKFLGYSISEKMKVFPDKNAAMIFINREEIDRFELGIGDTEGLVNYPLKLTGIKFSTLIIEREDLVKLSFRSIEDFDVNDFARKHFLGGGHKNAAGGQSKLSLEKTVQKFIRILDTL